MVKSIQQGGKGDGLSPGIIGEIKAAGAEVTRGAAGYSGCGPTTCAGERVEINNQQSNLKLSGGGNNALSLECPTVAGGGAI